MNPLLLIGGAVLALGLLGLLLSLLLRPAGSKAHLTVADLQARLADEESATAPETGDETEPDGQRADGIEAADSASPHVERPHPDADDTRDGDGTERSAASEASSPRRIAFK
ncbi:hypothetical protein [Nocardia niwae]|uniref:Uncharacterized protein n=1 Tax=Nocardia niwae TaxID=626084 RepID=A0ABV2XBM2_9NOCA|nr:hypothetical protein [Nocardia niwae]